MSGEIGNVHKVNNGVIVSKLVQLSWNFTAYQFIEIWIEYRKVTVKMLYISPKMKVILQSEFYDLLT